MAVIDTDVRGLERVKRGEMPFLERGAEPLLAEVLGKGMLEFSSDPKSAAGIPNLIITIGTPVDEFHSPTLKLIKQVIEELLPFMGDGQLIVMRSTVYPGTTEWLAKFLNEHGKKTKIAFCPERIVQGNALKELVELPQIVSGVTPEAEDAAAVLFGILTKRIVRLRPIEAEFAKLFCNAYRYIEFAAANQFYMMTSSVGVDYYRVLAGLKVDYPRAERIPGAGLTAGPCLFKDTMQLSTFFRNQFSIGNSSMLVNEGMPAFIVDLLRKRCRLEESTVGLLGMAFKADIDDPRSSLSYKLKKLLLFQAKSVLTADPFVRGDPDILPLESVIEKSNILVLCTPHAAYKGLDPKGKEIIDIWGFLPARSKPA